MTKTQRMFTLVEQWKQSGITRKEFCRQADIKVGTFAYWVAKYKEDNQQSDPGGFVRVEASAQPASRVEITYPNGVMIRSEEHTSELQSRGHILCRLMLE